MGDITDNNRSTNSGDETQISYESDSDLTKQEKLRDIKENDPGLSKYPMDDLTYEHIRDHNKRFSEYGTWSVRFKVVYNASQMLYKLSKIIKARCNEMKFEPGQIISINHKIECRLLRKSYFYPLRIVDHQGAVYLTLNDILQYINISDDDVNRIRLECRVGKMKVKADAEIVKEMQEGIDLASLGIEDIKHEIATGDGKYSVEERSSLFPIYTLFQHEYGKRKPSVDREYLDAFHNLCKELHRRFDKPAAPVTLRNVTKHNGDLNMMQFVLPLWCSPTESLRSFLRTYTPLDTTFNPDDMQRKQVFEILSDTECHDFFVNSLRDSVHESSEFDTSLDKAGAWEFLEESSIANDIPTDGQLLVLAARDKRPRPPTELEMQKRREVLLARFCTKYFKSDNAKVERYKAWAEAMMLSEAKFQALFS